jgi:hypothetical protein
MDSTWILAAEDWGQGWAVVLWYRGAWGEEFRNVSLVLKPEAKALIKVIELPFKQGEKVIHSRPFRIISSSILISLIDT